MNAEQLKRLEEIKDHVPPIVSLDDELWLIARLEAEVRENERLQKQIQADASIFEARLLAEIDSTSELLVVAEARCAEVEAQASEAEAYIRELETQIADAARVTES